MVRRNPPKLRSSFAQASEDTRIPPRSGDRGFLRRRVMEARGWRLEAKAKPLEDTVHGARQIKNEKARATCSCPAPFVSSLST